MKLFSFKDMKTNWLLWLLALLLISSCSQHNTSSEKKPVEPIYWPSKPAKAMIQYLGAFSDATDLNISRSLWARFIDFFAGEKSTRLVKPMAVIADPEGVIYVADPGARGVHRFDQANQSYTLIIRKNDHPLLSPIGLVLDDQSNLIISDSKLAKLYKVNKGEDIANEFITEATFKQPTGLVAGGNNDFYVTDTAEHKILNISFSGELIREIGHRGTGDGEFNYPTMINFSKDHLLVSDTLNFRIQALDKQGDFISKFGQIGNATGHQSRSKGIATDMNQNIYVVDGLFHTVQIFDNTGNFLLNFGEQGQEAGEFWLPVGIFIDNQQTIYVTDTYNQRIQMFRFLGAKL
ncbi:MAG: 6-bladed beta-propeller [Gammaproteobacteria bacterium]|nr:6-bladed beta-propeller [Gammaproteobacteria bacterium]